jgi:hypothetical protein
MLTVGHTFLFDVYSECAGTVQAQCRYSCGCLASTMCYDVPWVWFEAQHVVAAREVFAGTMVPVEVYETGV